MRDDNSSKNCIVLAKQKIGVQFLHFEQWLAELIGQGAEAAHVFADTDDASLFYQVEGGEAIEVGIRSRHFVTIEIPSCPMDGAGYRVYSKARETKA